MTTQVATGAKTSVKPGVIAGTTNEVAPAVTKTEANDQVKVSMLGFSKLSNNRGKNPHCFLGSNSPSSNPPILYPRPCNSECYRSPVPISAYLDQGRLQLPCRGSQFVSRLESSLASKTSSDADKVKLTPLFDCRGGGPATVPVTVSASFSKEHSEINQSKTQTDVSSIVATYNVSFVQRHVDLTRSR